MTSAMLNLDSADASADALRQASQVLRAGGLVVIPTETVYGVAASAANLRGYNALRGLKNKPTGQAFAVHLPDPAAAERYVDMSSLMLQRLTRRLMPGPVTLVVDVNDEVIDTKIKNLGLNAAAKSRLYADHTISLRCPAHPVAQAVLAAVPGPVIATTASTTHGQSPADARTAQRLVGDKVDLVIDGGHCRFAKPSTVVRVRQIHGQYDVQVLRSGVYDERYIRKLLRSTILIVCSGNTCRSPMAEHLARQLIAQQRNVAPDQLEKQGVRVISAGTFASPGAPASAAAVQVGAKLGFDLSNHRSKPVTLEMINEADAIYCMGQSHVQSILRMAPYAADKTLPLDPNGDIEDPIGADLQTYQRTAEIIRRRLVQRLKEQQL